MAYGLEIRNTAGTLVFNTTDEFIRISFTSTYNLAPGNQLNISRQNFAVASLYKVLVIPQASTSFLVSTPEVIRSGSSTIVIRNPSGAAATATGTVLVVRNA